jgi:SAM-dependent methyltransferase
MSWVEWLDELVCSGGPEPTDYMRLNDCLRDLARERSVVPHGPAVVEAARAVLAPTLLKGTIHGFVHLRPHGHAVDYELLERILSYHHSTDPNLVRWDSYCHALPVARALRSRAMHLRALLEQLEESADNEPLRVLHFRSGPGREFADYFIARGSQSRLRCDCVDPDPAAVLHGRRNVARMTDRMTFHQAPLLRYRAAWNYRLIWASSLCETLDDRALGLVIRRLLRQLEPGGKIVLCQLSRPDASACLLDVLADSQLHYRDAETLEEIALEAGAYPDAVRVLRDPTHANLYLHLHRPFVPLRRRSRRRTVGFAIQSPLRWGTSRPMLPFLPSEPLRPAA